MSHNHALMKDYMGLVTYLYTSMNLHATQKRESHKIKNPEPVKIIIVIKNQIS